MFIFKLVTNGLNIARITNPIESQILFYPASFHLFMFI